MKNGNSFGSGRIDEVLKKAVVEKKISKSEAQELMAFFSSLVEIELANDRNLTKLTKLFGGKGRLRREVRRSARLANYQSSTEPVWHPVQNKLWRRVLATFFI